VPASYLRIVDAVNARHDQYAVFSVFVYSSGETEKYVAYVTFNQSGNDTSYIRAGPGDFWINVITANLNSWTIEVQTQQ
jgi:hypothetical protein